MNIFINYVVIIFIVFFIELILSAKWSGFYFTRGIKIYFRELNYVDTKKLSVHSLDKEANRSNWVPLISTKIKEDKIFIGHKIFQIKMQMFVKQASPMMYGEIFSDSTLNKTYIKGYLKISNLLIFFLPIVLIFFYNSMGIELQSKTLVVSFAFIICTFLMYFVYRIDKNRFDNISNYINENSPIQ